MRVSLAPRKTSSSTSTSTKSGVAPEPAAFASLTMSDSWDSETSTLRGFRSTRSNQKGSDKCQVLLKFITGRDRLTIDGSLSTLLQPLFPSRFPELVPLLFELFPALWLSDYSISGKSQPRLLDLAESNVQLQGILNRLPRRTLIRPEVL